MRTFLIANFMNFQLFIFPISLIYKIFKGVVYIYLAFFHNFPL